MVLLAPVSAVLYKYVAPSTVAVPSRYYDVSVEFNPCRPRPSLPR